MGSLGGFEWLIIILVVLLLFGAKRIPELARGLGQGINEFRKASDEIKKEIDEGAKGTKPSSNTHGRTESSTGNEAPSASQQQSAESAEPSDQQVTESTENEKSTNKN